MPCIDTFREALEDFLGEAHRYFREALEDFLAVVDPTTGEFPALMIFFTEGKLLGQPDIRRGPFIPGQSKPGDVIQKMGIPLAGPASGGSLTGQHGFQYTPTPSYSSHTVPTPSSTDFFDKLMESLGSGTVGAGVHPEAMATTPLLSDETAFIAAIDNLRGIFEGGGASI